MKLQCAGIDKVIEIKAFYDSLIDAMQSSQYLPGWKKDVYPDIDMIRESISNHELYYVSKGEEILGSCMIDHNSNEAYRQIQWSQNVSDEELFVIHALGVHPKFAGQGIAKQMVREIIRMAEEKNIRTIRLDVLDGNLPAEKVYMSVGFTYVTTMKMYYEDTGWTYFKAFEYIV